ncbi:MAG: tetratricopeptide repeat protein [Saprospiraceae bacterium]
MAFFISLLLSLLLHAQQKGATPITRHPSPATGHTYAVVVGISDYQDSDIPDLRFADRDAEAFANFLRSPAGGSLDGDHLQLLTNEHATGAQIFTALDWLIDEVQEGDRVIIYFSGHGDVESKRISQPGYLLGWDAPARVYAAGGTMNIRDFQDYVSTLSVNNRGNVLVITDACHSGKLSGSGIDGAQLTNQNLARQYQNEVKILSCQPNEYSIEGEQWGGGRGAFSYHLVDGLYGMADGNADGAVNLLEIGRYLQDKVTSEVAPQSQVPMTVGNFTEKLVDVFPDVLAQIREGKKGQLQLFTATESRGIEDEVLAAADSNIVEMYAAFQQAIKDKKFLEPAGACANFYYEILSKEPQLERLHASMRRNYAAALQDDVQQVLNKWLKNDVNEVMMNRQLRFDKYNPYPQYLQRAAELLGPEHYMYPILLARKLYFEGYLAQQKEGTSREEFGQQVLEKYRASLLLVPDQPVVYYSMSSVFGNTMMQADSMEYFAELATGLIPSWVVPYITVGNIYKSRYKDFGRSKIFLEKASGIDSNSLLVLNAWGLYYFDLKDYPEAEAVYKKLIALDSTNSYNIGRNNFGMVYRATGRIEEAIEMYKKAIEIEPTNSYPYSNLGFIYSTYTKEYSLAEKYLKKAIQLDSNNANFYFRLASVFNNTRHYDKAEEQYKKAIQFDSTNIGAYLGLGNIYTNSQRYGEAETQYKKIIQIDSTYAFAYSNLGIVYSIAQRYDEAEILYKKAIQLDTTFTFPYYNLACDKIQQNQPDKAFYYLEQALKLGYKAYDFMQQDTDIAPLREHKEQWQALMKKYFPGQYKD